MSNEFFKLINPTSTPQDQYVVEIVTLEFSVLSGMDKSGHPQYCSLRMPYLRKRNKEGGYFWSAISTGVQYNDKKNYIHPRFSDSFLTEDIETFLNNRSWETKVNPNASPSAFTPTPEPFKTHANDEEVPF
jgi:hypothetical protein